MVEPCFKFFCESSPSFQVSHLRVASTMRREKKNFFLQKKKKLFKAEHQLFFNSHRAFVFMGGENSESCWIFNQILSFAVFGLKIVLSTKVFRPIFRYLLQLWTKVAGWYIFKPKIPIWVNFGGSCNGRRWYILWPSGLFYGHCGMFFLFWYVVPRKIWQPCYEPAILFT
jgi:hypothetical protein